MIKKQLLSTISQHNKHRAAHSAVAKVVSRILLRLQNSGPQLFRKISWCLQRGNRNVAEKAVPAGLAQGCASNTATLLERIAAIKRWQDKTYGHSTFLCLYATLCFMDKMITRTNSKRVEHFAKGHS